MDFNHLKKLLEGNTELMEMTSPNGYSSAGSPAEQVGKLMHELGNYLQPPVFKVGDIVRCRKELSTQIKHWDQPHIVVEVMKDPCNLLQDCEKISSCTATKKMDIVVIAIFSDGSPVSHFADRRDYELYPDSDKLKPRAS